MTYYPVSADVIPKLYTVSSIASLFDNLHTIPERISDTETGSTSESQAIDHANELLDTVSDAPPPNVVVTSGETTRGTATIGNVTETGISSSTHFQDKDNLEGDAQNDGRELAFTKLYAFSSIASLFDNLHTIPERISDTHTDSTSESQAIDHTNELLDTVIDDPPPNVVVTSGETTTGTTTTGYVTETGISSSTHFSEDKDNLEGAAQNDGRELAFTGCDNPVVSDVHTLSYISAVDPSSYVISEDLLVGSHRPLCTLNLDDHVSESELPQSVDLETVSHDEHFSTEEERKQECFQANKLQSCPGYVPNTHLLRSVERNSDALCCQSCEGSASPSVSGLMIGIQSPSQLFSPSSPHHCRTPSESSIGYFHDIIHNQIHASSEMLYTSANTGYIIDSSAGEDRQNHPSTTCSFPLENELPTY